MSSLGFFLMILAFSAFFLIYTLLRPAVELGYITKRTPLIFYVLLPTYRALRGFTRTIIIIVLLLIVFPIEKVLRMNEAIINNYHNRRKDTLGVGKPLV